MGLTDYSRMDKEFFESGVRAERERIIKLLETERDTWARQASFSYKMALTELIEKIKND